MKIKEFRDLRNKDAKSLIKMAGEKKQALAKKSMEVNSGKEKNVKVRLNLKREIAKILTLIREKEILEKLERERKSQ